MVRSSDSTQTRPGRRRKLTPQTVKALRPGPSGRRIVYADTGAPGLRLRVGADSRDWYFQFSIRGRTRLMRLGAVDEIREDQQGKKFPFGLAAARKEAQRLRGLVSQGVDPLEERRRTAVGGETFADLVKEWLASREASTWREKTRFEIERFSKKYFVETSIGKIAPSKITRADIRKLLDKIESDSVADHVRAYLRMVISWAVEHDRIPGVPLFPKRRRKYVPRARVLEHDEVRRVWAVLDSGKLGLLGQAFKLMLLTAQRRGEVLGLRWSEIDDDMWTIPAERTKNGKAHRVPLAAEAAAVLDQLREKTGECPVAFPSPKDENVPVANPQKAAERLWEKAEVEGATIHDLRRTAADGMARVGIPDVHVSYVLNHSGAREAARVTTATYLQDPKRFDGPKRLALETWERELRRILSRKKGKVVPISRGRA